MFLAPGALGKDGSWSYHPSVADPMGVWGVGVLSWDGMRDPLGEEKAIQTMVVFREDTERW